MIKKVDNCLYCGQAMESKTAKKRFCSTKCRVYYNREHKELLEPFEIIDLKLKKVSITPNGAHKLPTFADEETHISDAIKKASIEGQIKAIQGEKMPGHIKTSLGKKSWEFDQKKRIDDLKKQL